MEYKDGVAICQPEKNKAFTPEIYKQLLDAVDKLPKEAVERTKGADTRKGYDTTGYQYQFLVNILNEVVGVPNWSAEYYVIKEIEDSYKTGQKNWEITVSMRVTILGAVRNSAGGHKAAMHCDALKGAVTSALKKTLGLFGVGKKAYEGTIDDDYKPLPDDNDRKPAAKVAIPADKPSKAQTPDAGIKATEQSDPEDITTIYGARKAKVGDVVKCMRVMIEKIDARKVKTTGKDVVDYSCVDHTTAEGDNMVIGIWGKPDATISVGKEVDFFDVKSSEHKNKIYYGAKSVKAVK